MDENETTTPVAATETPTATDAATETPIVETPVDSDAAALAAFDKGVAEIAEPKAEAPVTTAADVAAAAAAAKTDDPKAAAPPAAGGAPLTVDHGKTDPTKKDEAAKDAAKVIQPDPETDAAVTELGLKGKAEARFREMAGTIKAQAQELEPMRIAAERGQQWENMVLETKSTPEQFGQAIGYLTYVNSGDPAKMGQAFDFLLGELQTLGKNIGREVPGLVDPIQDHQDLAQAVQFGEMTRAAALELAQRRTSERRYSEHQNVTTEQAKKEQEFNAGMTAVAELSTRLKAEDPAFEHKLKFIAPALDAIRQNVHPSQWVEKIEAMYRQVPAIPAVAPVAATPTPARPPVGAMPLRATGAGAPMARSLKDASDLDAFEMGLQSVSR